MLSSGLTLIFSMMGVLNFAHASFYMLGAYFAYTISGYMGFWGGLIFAPILVGVVGALIQRYGLRYVHRWGHVAELVFTFGLAFLIEEVVQFFWGKATKDYHEPELLDFPLFTLFGQSFPAYKAFMIFISIGIFIALLAMLTRTRVGLIIQAAITHPNTVANLGHNVPLVFMGVFGVGSALAGLAGVIAGPALGNRRRRVGIAGRRLRRLAVDRLAANLRDCARLFDDRPARSSRHQFQRRSYTAGPVVAFAAAGGADPALSVVDPDSNFPADRPDG
jgi:branched-subunit amino acid ABC-type transport system permease component